MNIQNILRHSIFLYIAIAVAALFLSTLSGCSTTNGGGSVSGSVYYSSHAYDPWNWGPGYYPPPGAVPPPPGGRPPGGKPPAARPPVARPPIAGPPPRPTPRPAPMPRGGGRR